MEPGSIAILQFIKVTVVIPSDPCKANVYSYTGKYLFILRKKFLPGRVRLRNDRHFDHSDGLGHWEVKAVTWPGSSDGR